MSATASPQGLPGQAAENQLQTRSRTHLSRQPVKYYRQGSAGAQSRKTSAQLRDENISVSGEGLVSGSADSSRSSSPEPLKTLLCLQETVVPQDKTESQTGAHAGVQRTVSQESVQAGASSFVREGNTNQSNNTLRGRERLIRSLRRRSVEEKTSQKVLSGLRLNSGRGEQLHFV